MIEIVYRYDPRRPAGQRLPASPAEALAWLREGNDRFADLVTSDPGDEGEARRATFDIDLSAAAGPSETPEQRPFGIVLSCADARVPVEMVFGQAVNALFVVRVAGNVIGSDCLGSIDYAVHHFHSSVKVLVVLGHSSCGAIGAAVEAFLRPGAYLSWASSYPLRSIVDRILVSVRVAVQALENVHGPAVSSRPGYQEALVTCSVACHAAYVAYSLREELRGSLADTAVVWGTYNLASRRVAALGHGDVGLVAPPDNAEGFRALLEAVAAGCRP